MESDLLSGACLEPDAAFNSLTLEAVAESLPGNISQALGLNKSALTALCACASYAHIC